MTECWTCKGPTVQVSGVSEMQKSTLTQQQFRICKKCNPPEEIELNIDGCEIVCWMCDSSTAHDSDAGSYCIKCDKFICENCEGRAVYSKDDEKGECSFKCTACMKEDGEDVEDD